uniref:Putative secreted protein n=1 Tax=Anopheles darlingi TaxID=43151 RepID=A0A2M4D917_ANODA
MQCLTLCAPVICVFIHGFMIRHVWRAHTHTRCPAPHTFLSSFVSRRKGKLSDHEGHGWIGGKKQRGLMFVEQDGFVVGKYKMKPL